VRSCAGGGRSRASSSAAPVGDGRQFPARRVPAAAHPRQPRRVRMPPRRPTQPRPTANQLNPLEQGAGACKRTTEGLAMVRAKVMAHRPPSIRRGEENTAGGSTVQVETGRRRRFDTCGLHRVARRARRLDHAATKPNGADPATTVILAGACAGAGSVSVDADANPTKPFGNRSVVTLVAAAQRAARDPTRIADSRANAAPAPTRRRLAQRRRYSPRQQSRGSANSKARPPAASPPLFHRRVGSCTELNGLARLPATVGSTGAPPRAAKVVIATAPTPAPAAATAPPAQRGDQRRPRWCDRPTQQGPWTSQEKSPLMGTLVW
jgi:hypothetical protein